jgi:solute carrier family 35 protein E3
MSATGFALGNVASSVALVLVNKKVFAGGFHYPMSLSFFHFIFTVIWYQLLAVVGQYTPPPSGSDMPTGEKFKVALAGFASIGFMNLSLNTNSVGFYQITKLTIIPVTLVINAVAYGVHANAKIKIALSILLLGVGVATVTDVDLRPVGILFGLLAVLTTAVFQIWQGTKQKEFGISATQLQAGIAAWQTAQAFAVAAATELYCYTTPADGSPCDTTVEFFKSALLQGDAGHQRTLWIVLGTCFLALAVNLCSFGLIGKTSAITFQVVGHAKTCLVLVGGYLLFPSKLADTQQLYNNIAGVSFAMIGVILYGHLKHASSQDAPDCLDMVCPGCCLYYIEPKYSEAEREETEGLKGGANA